MPMQKRKQLKPHTNRIKNVEPKMKVLRGKNKLKVTEIYINQDFPREILNQRRELIKHMRTARQQEYKAILIYN